MKLATSWGRFCTPFSNLFPSKPAEKTDAEWELEYNKKLVGSAKRCFDSPEGEFILKHLIKEVGLDAQIGVQSPDDANYNNGQQDIVRYMLSLVN